jgi:hypothetical protein
LYSWHHQARVQVLAKTEANLTPLTKKRVIGQIVALPVVRAIPAVPAEAEDQLKGVLALATISLRIMGAIPQEEILIKSHKVLNFLLPTSTLKYVCIYISTLRNN